MPDTAPDPGRPRRGNGHASSSWVRLTDIDPVLAEHLLAVLGDAGIAAYAAPVAGAVGGVDAGGCSVFAKHFA